MHVKAPRRCVHGTFAHFLLYSIFFLLLLASLCGTVSVSFLSKLNEEDTPLQMLVMHFQIFQCQSEEFQLDFGFGSKETSKE